MNMTLNTCVSNRYEHDPKYIKYKNVKMYDPKYMCQ